MATTTLTMNPQLITVPANTSEHEINFDGVLVGPVGSYGTCTIERMTGTSVQINSSGIAITSATGAINSTITKMLLPIKKGVNLRYKGGAGSETFQISILHD